jgi:hypothetical protein
MKVINNKKDEVIQFNNEKYKKDNIYNGTLIDFIKNTRTVGVLVLY